MTLLTSSDQSDVGDQLCLFARDEMITWLQARNRTWTVDLAFRQNVQVNIDTIMKRIETMGCKIEHDQVRNDLYVLREAPDLPLG